MLSAPCRCEILPLPIRNKVLACLATRFNVSKATVGSIVKLDQLITQYGRVTRLEGGDLMIGRDFVQESEDSRDASFVQVECNILFLHVISKLSFSSMLNMWINMLTEKGQHHS